MEQERMDSWETRRTTGKAGTGTRGTASKASNQAEAGERASRKSKGNGMRRQMQAGKRDESK